MSSQYLVQIICSDGSAPTQLIPGGTGERNLTLAIQKAILSKGE